MEDNKRTQGKWETKGLTVTCYGSGIICKCILPQEGGCFDAIGNAQIISKAVNEYDKLKEERDLLIDNLFRIVDRIEENNLQSNFPSAYQRAKELLTTIKK